MSGQIQPVIRKNRNTAYRAVFESSAMEYRQKFIGRSIYVLWESMVQLNERGWQMEGLTGNYLRVRATAQSPRWNIVDDVKLIRSAGDVIAGEIIADL